MSVSTKRALLIGIDYITNPNARLYGCIEDIKNVQNMLIDAYGYPPENIVALRDDMPTKLPTKQNILLALQMIVSVSGVNDEIWIHYSGHGTQLQDRNGDEVDGLDEAIVPVDYPTAGMIIDDDLFNLVRSIKCKAFLVFDSCHSGSVCDLQYSINYVKGSFSKNITSNKYISNPNIVVLSGCRDAQTSADAFNKNMNEYGGALTLALTGALRQNKHSVDLMKVYNDLCYLLLQGQFDQIPVLSSSRTNPVWTFSRPVTTKIVTISTSTSNSVSASAKSVENTPVKSSPSTSTSTSAGYSLPPSIVFQPKNSRGARPKMGLFM
jgi:hypothetical protein